MVLNWFDRLKLPVTVLLAALIGTVGAAQSGDNSQDRQEEVVFRPPDAGAPADRVGAGTRHLAQQGSSVILLVPEGGGIATVPRPVLVWYLARDFDGAVHAQIAAVSDLNSGVARLSEGPLRAGYYALDLARSEMVLSPGQMYEWKVLLLEDADGAVLEEKRAYVERAQAPAQTEDPVALAAQGLWFDALGAFVQIGLSGRVQIADPRGFAELVRSAGVAEVPVEE